METDVKSLLIRLKETSQKAAGKLAEERKEKELNSLKEKAKKIFNDYMTEEKMMLIAGKAINKYPLLFIDTQDRPKENKKTGYRFEVGELGKSLFDELKENGFEPTIIEVSSDDVKHYNMRCARYVGYYLGIVW